MPHDRTRRTNAAAILAVAVLSGLSGYLLRGATVAEETAPLLGSAPIDDTWRSELRAVEERVMARIAELEMAAPTVVERAPARHPEEGPTVDQDVRPLLEELQETVAGLRAQAAASPGGPADLPDRRTPPRWSEVQRLVDLGVQDGVRADEELLLLTHAQVMRRLGRPTEVYSPDGNMTWKYESEDGSLELTLRFADGYVASCTYDD